MDSGGLNDDPEKTGKPMQKMPEKLKNEGPFLLNAEDEQRGCLPAFDFADNHSFSEE